MTHSLTGSLRALVLASLTLSFASAASAGETLDIQYAKIPGVDVRLNQLDVIHPDRGRDLPVLVYIHGGSWAKGDKGEVRRALSFRDQVRRRNHVLVSVNFRPWPQTNYRGQMADIARALRWVHDKIRKYRGSKKKVFLIGHSSGAHLVSLMGTDRTYLHAQRLPLSFIKGVIPLDIQAYDIPRAVRTAVSLGWPNAKRTLERVFGTTPRVQWHASPIAHLKRGREYPDFHVVYASFFGTTPQVISEDQSLHFGRALRRTGVRHSVNTYPNENHVSLVHDFGDPLDPVTIAVERFIDRILARIARTGR